MINVRRAHTRVVMLGVILALNIPAVSSARAPSVPGTRDLLSLLLVGPAAGQRIADDAQCTKASDASTIRDDVIYFLAKLAKKGSVTSECNKDAEALSCRLVIGQNTGRDEGIWTRTYEMTLTPKTHALTGKVACFTIP